MKKKYSLVIIFIFLFSFSYSQISTFPHSSSFEDGDGELSSDASDATSKWVSANEGTVNGAADANFNTTGILTFQEASGATPSSGTGPSSAQTGSQYIFIESSGQANENKVFKLAAVYDFRGKTNAQLSFYYHNYSSQYAADTSTNYGPASMVVWIYDQDANSWSSVWTYDKTSMNLNQWQSVTIDLSAYDNKNNIQIWFSGATDYSNVYWNWGYQSDFIFFCIIY